MSTKYKALALAGIEAISQYNRDLAAGGEPVYPQWADDAAALLANSASMISALEVARAFIAIANGETAPFVKIALEKIDDALELAGVVTLRSLTWPQADIWSKSESLK